MRRAHPRATLQGWPGRLWARRNANWPACRWITPQPLLLPLLLLNNHHLHLRNHLHNRLRLYHLQGGLVVCLSSLNLRALTAPAALAGPLGRTGRCGRRGDHETGISLPLLAIYFHYLSSLSTAFCLYFHCLSFLRHCLSPVFSLAFFAKTLPFACAITVFLR